MRPRSIVRFEWIVYLNQLLGILSLWVSWDAMSRLMPRPVGMWAAIYSLGFFIALNLTLCWLIAYRASRIARWILIAIVGLSFLALADIDAFRRYGRTYMMLAAISYLLSAISVGLLFRRDAREWFARRQPIDSDIFS